MLTRIAWLPSLFALATRSSDKIVALMRHDDAETGATKQFPQTLRGIQGQILLTLKRI
jgi:hypothetical protein